MVRAIRSPFACSLMTLVSLSALAVGCGSPLAGTYTAEHRVIEGMSESSEQGYSLEDFRAKRPKDNPSLILNRNGRFEWNTGSVINEGAWRVKGDTLYLRTDINDGRPIGAALQLDREWRIGESGEIFRTDAFQLYRMEEVYVPE